MLIRKSKKLEYNDIEKLYMLAFGEKEGPIILELVHNLFKDNSAIPFLSLVALEDEKIVGHILFTKALIENIEANVQILAPLAVLPEYQNKGFGSELIRQGLDSLREQGVSLVFVLGYPKYYSKLGFMKDAKKYGFEAPYTIDEKNKDAWTVQELAPGIIGKEKGKIKCSDSLQKEEYWKE
jgi:putative acetyltransferase